MKFFIGILTIIVLLGSSHASQAKPEIAFDGALGFGQFTQGGKGGERYLVTSLTDNPDSPQPGTLRYALKQKGPRIIEFAVSGVIHLKQELEIHNDYVSVLGQSSPGGIVLTGAQTSIKANQVILRYLRFRPGHLQGEGDALTARNQHHIIIDHCSLSWANDEVASFYNNQQFTLQYSIIAESLRNAGHHKGSHGYGGIWGGAKASFLRNVVAHHDSRNPRINGYRLKPEYPQQEALTDIRNNVFFNWGDNSGYGAEGTRFNLVNNYYKPGPASDDIRFFELWSKPDLPASRAFISGNVMAGYDTISNDNKLGLTIKNHNKLSRSEIAEVFQTTLADSPFDIAPSETLTAGAAYQRLIIDGDVGANKNARGRFSDSVDTRLLSEIRNGKPTFGNGLIDSELSVLAPGGWAAYQQEFTAHN
ncbi:MAG: pectate lyase C [Pseudomonadota bacterium]|nr:pectate lyase C [Pseudomonadota bacterium]